MDSPICLWAPHFLLFLFIYLFIIIVIIFIAFLPSHCGGSFPSQWSSSPSHCWAPPLLTVGSSPSHCLIGLLPPSAWGPFASHSSEGLLPIFPWGSSPCYYGGCLPSWLLGSPPFLEGAPPLSLGLIPISFTQLWGFPTSLWGFHTSLWGSSPFLRGASSRCGALPHLAHSTVGPTHICVGLFTIFPWVFISLWGSSPSRSLNCGASPRLSVGLFPLSPRGFLSLRGSSLSRSLNCTLTQLWHSTGSCILLLAPSSRGGGGRGGGLLPLPPTHLISPFPTWGKPCFPMLRTLYLPSHLLLLLMYHTYWQG